MKHECPNCGCKFSEAILSDRPVIRTDDAFAWTREWNASEKRILRSWVESGMTIADAEATLTGDLRGAAEEDGYDGP